MKTKSAIEQFRAPAFHGGQRELAVAVGGEPLGASHDQLTSDPLTLPSRLDQAVRDERDTFLDGYHDRSRQLALRCESQARAHKQWAVIAVQRFRHFRYVLGDGLPLVVAAS